MALIKRKLIFKNENINVTLKSFSIQSKTAINRNALGLKALIDGEAFFSSPLNS